jgi:tyrosine-protein phosphatase SIW14
MARLRHRRNRSKLFPSARLAAVVLAASLAARAADQDPVHVRNFGRVDATLYRGAEPSSVALEELQRLGVKLIIDLRQTSAATLRERDEAQQLHMQYLNLPLRPMSAPSKDDVRRVLVLLENRGSNPVFLHCWRGKDRTGTIVACYRIQHDGWPNSKALAEAKDYGMSWAERAMRSFVAHFEPFPKGSLDPTSLAPLTASAVH